MYEKHICSEMLPTSVLQMSAAFSVVIDDSRSVCMVYKILLAVSVTSLESRFAYCQCAKREYSP